MMNTLQEQEVAVKKIKSQKQETNNDEADLKLIRDSHQIVNLRKKKPIEFSEPILLQDKKAVIYPNTINLIQGKPGVHKSRLAEIICAALLKKEGCNNDLLNIHAPNQNAYAVCYVDTERNHTEQLPYAIQQIQLKAGYGIEDDPQDFDYISLLDFGRNVRFKMLKLYVEDIRKKYNKHIFIVLDVITDCVFNFNDSGDSMKLIDLMNQMINRYNVTFLCLIHENPGNTAKARGHVGTELMNKASTVLQIGFMREAKNRESEIIRISYLKCRNSKKHEPFFALYSDSERSLVQADKEGLENVIHARIQKANYDDIVSLLSLYLSKPLPRKELLDLICTELQCRERTAEKRLKEIADQRIPIKNGSGIYTLIKDFKGQEIMYSLTDE